MANNATEQHVSSAHAHPLVAIAAAGGADGGDGGRNSGGPPSGQYDDVESAAAKLGIGTAALRARCRRAARLVGDSIVASLGGGITAFKFGRTWRFIFPRRS